MTQHAVVPWSASAHQVVPTEAQTPAEIAHHAKQLRPREVEQVVAAFEARHYDIASTFIWSKAIAALKKQLGTLGSEFIGEMLQRPDIDAGSDIVSSVTDSEAISLAEDLGIVSSTEAMRLRHAHEVIHHFAQFSDENEDAAEGINVEEAIGCLRTCINSILGRPVLEVARDFADFRRQLEEKTFGSEDEAILGLINSPYFFRKTTLSVLLSLLKTRTGAQLQHAIGNTSLILPLVWAGLRKPERWQAGQTYAELYADGKREAMRGLRNALSRVGGFDYVPENLRSATFTKAAKEVLQAHEGLNNFYNEPGPMRALASLGSTIPAPAFPLCMKATLCVWLGNRYGHTWAAQDSTAKILKGLTNEQWQYYLNETLPGDREILFKLQEQRPMERWIELIKAFKIHPESIHHKDVKQLVEASIAGNQRRVEAIAETILNRNFK